MSAPYRVDVGQSWHAEHALEVAVGDQRIIALDAQKRTRAAVVRLGREWLAAYRPDIDGSDDERVYNTFKNRTHLVRDIDLKHETVVERATGATHSVVIGYSHSHGGGSVAVENVRIVECAS